MKQLYTAIFLLITSYAATSQNITFTDLKFKTKLLTSSTSNNVARNQQYQNIKIDANNDGEIQQSEALAIYHLYVRDLTSNNNTDDITSFDGLQHFTNLISFDGAGHAITTFNISLPNIEKINVGSNNLSSLNVSGLATLKDLECRSNNITQLTLTGLINLKSLNCSDNPLTTLNISGLTALETLWCYDIGLANLDLTGHTNLHGLYCKNNNFTTLDFTGAPNLWNIECGGNNITVLDVSGLPNLNSVDADPMPSLTTLLANNGSYIELSLYNAADLLPNLRYICVAEASVSFYNDILVQYEFNNCTVGSYCPVANGPNFNIIEGTVRFDSDGNGCTIADALSPNALLHINDGSTSGYTYTNNLGYYRLPVSNGNFTISPVYTNQYYSATPSSSSVSFTTNFNTHTANFCIGANGTHPDLEVKILPIITARPGFNARYNIVVTNKGDMVQSGSVNFLFDDTKLDYLAATPALTNQATGGLTWSFSNLLPFQSKVYDVTLKVNTPLQTPPVNINDILAFTSTIITAQTDTTPADNTFQLNQVVIGSYDPNDKQVVQGATISPAQASGYLDYIIRFQNSGTAEAINVVVKDMLASNLDPATFVPIAASHPYRATLTATNKLEFIFENINLPAEQDNEPASHGFIAFKVKPKNTVTVGNTIDNTAEIYFDYNAPIITNTVSTTVATLMAGDFEFGSEMMLHPNPAKDIVTISKKGDINITSISVYNMLGQLVLTVPNSSHDKNILINVASLKAGSYMLKVNSDKGRSTQTFIKN